MVKNKLIRTRKEKKFSQQDIAEYLNISQTQYVRKEKGDVEISETEWEKIAKLLDVEITDIREDDSKNISLHFDNISGNYVGSHNYYCNIPEFMLENQKELFDILKEKIAKLEQENSSLKENLKKIKGLQ